MANMEINSSIVFVNNLFYMSNSSFKNDILFYQRFLKCCGFYTDTLDGTWGPNTAKADAAFQTATQAIATQYGLFDTRSEENIATLVPKAQEKARLFLSAAKAYTYTVRIISGTRTYAEQDALYKQGRFGDNPANRVTNAQGGQSNHNFGIAWDVGIFLPGGDYDTGENNHDANYIALDKLVLPEMQGIEWGGSWHSIVDNPHYQLTSVSDDISVVRNLFESGQPYV